MSTFGADTVATGLRGDPKGQRVDGVLGDAVRKEPLSPSLGEQPLGRGQAQQHQEDDDDAADERDDLKKKDGRKKIYHHRWEETKSYRQILWWNKSGFLLMYTWLLYTKGTRNKIINLKLKVSPWFEEH